MALFGWFTRRRQRDNDLEEEIRSHLALAAQDRVADGDNADVARLAAVKEFGNVALTTEAARSVWHPWWFETVRDVVNDIHYATRVLRKSPGFSLIVIAVLALGISLNATVFTIFKSLALKPLAGVTDSSGLAVVLARTNGGNQVPLSYPDYRYLRDRDRAFSGLSGSALSAVHLGTGSHGERVMAEFVTGNYFQVLGVPARLGRTLLPSDEVTPGRHPVVVLSDGLWQRAFGSDPDIIGKTIRINAQPLTVVGVAGPDFHGTIVSFDIEAFIPVMMAPQMGLMFQERGGDVLSNRKAELLMVLGRPAPGTSLDTASVQTEVLSAQLAIDEPRDDISERLRVLPIWQSPYGAQTYMLPAVVVLGAMGTLLLLVVCANIAGLVLVRGVARRGEIAVRLALGASRARIVRLLLVENLVLAIPAAAIGVLLVSNVMPRVWAGAAAAAPGRMFMNVAVDRTVFVFAALASVATALFFGFVPALRSSRVDLMSVMKDDLSPRGSSRSRLRAALVVAQVALSLLLLVGAGLVSRSLDAARNADAGFDASRVISVTVDLAPNGYDQTRGWAFYEQLLNKARADKDIESATLATIYPMMLIEFPGQKMELEGYQPQRDEDLAFLTNTVAPGYFRTLRIRLVTGREFERRDDASAAQVVIVNDTLARRFWGSPQDALGKRLRVASSEWRTVIGVAQDVKYTRINEAARPYVYLPFLQAYQSSMILHTRASAGSISTGTQIDLARLHLASLDPELPILGAQSLGAQAGASLTIFFMTAALLLTFGVAGMGLAAMGIYGLVSYTVKQSTHEIGIRMALGAQPRDVIRRFMGCGLWLGAIGTTLGIIASLAVTRLLGSVLYGVSALDTFSFITAVVVVLTSALVATLVPAWRGARTSPMIALRHQ